MGILHALIDLRAVAVELDLENPVVTSGGAFGRKLTSANAANSAATTKSPPPCGQMTSFSREAGEGHKLAGIQT